MEYLCRRFKISCVALCDRGSIPIDELWSIDDMLATQVSHLPHVFGAGDHKVILVDFDINDLLGIMMNARSPSMRRLTCENKSAVEKHNL